LYKPSFFKLASSLLGTFLVLEFSISIEVSLILLEIIVFLDYPFCSHLFLTSLTLSLSLSLESLSLVSISFSLSSFSLSSFSFYSIIFSLKLEVCPFLSNSSNIMLCSCSVLTIKVLFLDLRLDGLVKDLLTLSPLSLMVEFLRFFEGIGFESMINLSFFKSDTIFSSLEGVIESAILLRRVDS